MLKKQQYIQGTLFGDMTVEEKPLVIPERKIDYSFNPE
jgi:hypothetical protein